MSANELIEARKAGKGVEVRVSMALVANLFCSHIQRITAFTVMGLRTQNKPHYNIGEQITENSRG